MIPNSPNRPAVLALLCCLLLATGSAYADIYVRDEGGVPLYTDQPTGKSFSLFMRTDDLPRNSQARRSDTRLLKQRMETYAPLIEQAARTASLEPELLHAVIMVESGYNAAALSPKGARGLMQLMPDTARRFGTTNANDPAQNLRGGARYLAQLVREFDGQLPLVLAAYNAGENAVRRHGGQIPPYAETQRYVPAVLARYELLRRKAGPV